VFDRKVLETVEQVRRATDVAASSAGGLLEAYKTEVERAVIHPSASAAFVGFG
jgi:hypothetical protein